MLVRFNLPSHLRRHAGGLKTVGIECSTVGDCILKLVRTYPGMHSELLQDGTLPVDYISVWVNGRAILPEEQWDHKIQDHDELDILYLYAGG